jgi:hypothetical protein
MSNAHHIAGLPEWADDEAANEAAAALGYSVAQDDDAQYEAERAQAQMAALAWRAAEAYFWAQAYLALEAKNYGAMRQLAGSAKDAGQKSNPMLRAIFGPGGAPDNAVVARGARLNPEAVKAAKTAVLAEMGKPRPRRR